MTVGSDPAAVVMFPPETPGVEPRHAEIRFVEEGCAFHLRALEGAVFVEGRQVREIILEHDDLLEFGVNGPKARFRVFAEEGSVCKPVRVMLRDARAVGRESGGMAGAGAMTRDLFTQASWKLKVGVPLLLLAIAVPVAALAGWFGGRSGDDQEVQRRVAAIEAQIRESQERERAVSRSEVDALRAELARRTEDLDRMRREDAALRSIYDESRRGVCLVHGIYGFVKNSRWLTDSGGSRLEREYTGSGFLVDADGWIVTNRHVAAPWTDESDQQALIGVGFEPRFATIRVLFPDREPIEVDADQTRLRADSLDVALLRVDAESISGVPLVPLAAAGTAGQVGDPVLVVGYPTGVNALLAKADAAIVGRITRTATDLGSVLDGLAEDRAISPLITRGSLNDLTPERLVYDADTTSGGSGGPVFGRDGTVVGVNFAVVRDFTGSNLGVPIRYVHELIDDLPE